MEIKPKTSLYLEKLKSFFIKKSDFSSKTELNLSSFKWLGITGIIVFISVVLLMPNDVPVEFSQKIESQKIDTSTVMREPEQKRTSSSDLWASPKSSYNSARGGGGGGGSEINYNTSMVVGSSSNAKTQLHAGFKLPLRILDKVIVSQEPVPILAELILNSETDSGLRLEAGTRFYGEASFMRGSNRASVIFKQISLPNGQMKPINAKALGKDGQAGVLGRVYSDGAKNTAGQVITSFVGGLAAGSVQTDVFGRSQGGIGNGILTAVAETAKSKAQSYGENLKAEREWIEIAPNTECDAQLFESMNLQSGAFSE